MNHFFKLVWSNSLGMLVPVPEVSRAVGHGGRRLSARARRRLAKRAMQSAGLGALAVLAPASAYALPQGGAVAAGTASISTNASTLTVNQTSSKAIINWQKFGIAPGESVNFQQPGSSSIALNRVLGNDPSQIFGHLTANGQIFLINPNGIVFAPGAQVNVGGLVASTLDMTDQNFLSGNYQFSGVSTASVVNYGKIKTFDGGYVAFIGNNVDNEGVIKTPGGTTAFGAGGSVAITLAGNSLVSFQVTTAALNAAVKNGGAIVAPNGVVLLTAQAKNALLQTVVNNIGLIQANSATSTGGVVTLLGGGGGVAVSGTINANSTSGVGGSIIVSGVNTAVSGTARISATGSAGGGTIAVGGGVHGGGNIPQAVTTSVAPGAVVDASATGSGAGGTVSVWSDVKNPDSVTTVSGTILARGAGSGAGGFVETSGHLLSTNAVTVQTGGGTWLLDPYNVSIVGSNSNASGTSFSGGTFNPNQPSAIRNISIQNALNGGNNVTIETSGSGTSNGNITVNAPITWNGLNNDTLTLNAYGNIVINAPITATSGTPTLSLAYGLATSNGTGASYIINAAVSLPSNATFSTQQGSNQANKIFYTVITSRTALQAINANGTNLASNYALGANITSNSNAVAGDFTPIGTSSSNAFTGKFEGLGHTISGLTISEPNTDNVGLFGYASGAVIRDVGLLNESVTGRESTGGLVGNNGGTITNSYVQGAVSGSSDVGGLAGINGGTITGSYATGGVTGSGTNTGGLVGSNNGTITGSYAAGNVTGSSDTGGLVGSNNARITGSYATGNVSGVTYTGGLVGLSSNATIGDAYATGNVSGYLDVGGLVGRKENGTIIDSYAAGQVNGANNRVGGLLGSNQGGLIDATYATGAVSGVQYVGGLVGYNFADTVIGSYATGTVTGASSAGGLVGISSSSSYTSSYWDETSSGKLTAGGGGSLTGVTGVTTTVLAGSLPAGFSSSLWTNAGGKTTPYLKVNEGLGPVSGSVLLGSDTTPTVYGVIDNQAQLQDINTTGLSRNYVLGANITATGDFTPIGINSNHLFLGNFEGLGHTISNLTIQHTSNSNAGLFGWAENATIRDVGLENETVLGSKNVGGLAGIFLGGTITNSYVHGMVSGTGSNVGGLVGVNTGTLTDVSVTGSVSGAGSNVGGLAGDNGGTINSNSFATANVTGHGGVGGLAGNNSNGTIINASAAGNVTGSGNAVGGLAGANSGTINLSHATGNVTGSSNVGGLVGQNNSGTITGTSNAMSYAAGNVTGARNVGGLAGINNSGTITGYHATGNVTGSSSNVGGLVGSNYSGTIIDSYATGYVTGRLAVGGLVGDNNSSNSNGNIGTITGSYATGGVTGTNIGSNVGGLVGRNGNGVITAVYAAGNVTGTKNVGGLVGQNDSGTITDAYATGIVTGSSSNVGGLVGLNTNHGTISDVYATGAVTGQSYAGGLVGSNSSNSTITNGYWDKTTDANQTNGWGGSLAVGGVTGLTTAQWLTLGPVAENVFSTNAWAAGYPYPVLKALPYIFITGSGSQSYGSSTVTATNISAVNGSGASAAGLVNANNIAWISSATVTSNAGSFFTLGGSGVAAPSGYQLTYGGTGTVAKAVLTVSGVAGTGKIYDGTTSDPLNGTAVVNGLMNGQTVAVTGTLANADAGSEAVSISLGSGSAGFLASNYTLTQPTLAAVMVTPATLTYTAIGASSVYGGPIASLSGTVTGVVNGESLANVTSGTAMFTAGATAASNVGTYGITGSGLSVIGGNYVFAQAAGNSTAYTITKATLTYTANAASSVYGGALALLGGSVAGLENGDLLTNVTTGNLTFSTSATSNSGAGSYGITGAGLSLISQNYFSTIGQAAGNATAYTINPATLTYTANEASSVYGGPIASATGTVSGVVNGDSLANVVSGTAMFSTSATSNSDAGIYGITGSGLTLIGGNYIFAQAAGNGAAYTITPAPLTITGLSGTDKIFDGTTSDPLTGTPVISGLVGGQTLTLGNATTGTLASANIGAEGVTASITLADGSGRAANYTLTQPALAAVTVLPVPSGSGGSSRSSGSSSTSSTAQPSSTPTVTVSPTGTITVKISETSPEFGDLGPIVASLTGGGSPLSASVLNAPLYKQLIAIISGGGGGNGFQLVIIIDCGVKKPREHFHVALSSTATAREAAATTRRFD